MKKLIMPLLLLATTLLACNLTPVPVSAPASPIATESVSAPEIAASPQPVVPADGLTVQDPMIIDPNAGQAKFRLMELGYDICTILTDYYTYQTGAAIRQFQAAAGLEPNGVLDATTLERLLADDAPRQMDVFPVPLNTSEAIYMEIGDALAVTPDSLWILQGGYFVQFSKYGEFLGYYQVEPLLGEENYLPVAVTFDGTYLWIAQQGIEDALAQAYDPTTANPVDGLLKPVFPESAHFPSRQLYAAAAFDGQTVWFLTDYMQAVILQPVDVNSGTAGTMIRVGESSETGYGYGIAIDPGTGSLWVTYGDEVFGEHAIVAVDPISRNVGPALGPCGLRVTYALSRLWFVNQQGLWSVDPVTGERVLYDIIPGEQAVFATDADTLWMLDSGGYLFKIETP